MHHKSIGFIGGGRITRIFIEGLQKSGKLPTNVVVCDPNQDVLQRLKVKFPDIQTSQNNVEAAGKDIVFLAVHPPMIAGACEQIKGAVSASALLISLAPKFTIKKLGELLNGFSRIVRVIPNAPSIIGAGFNPVCFSQSMTDADKSEVKSLLEPLGECPEVNEEKLEAYAILSAMGPTYLWFQLQALREVVSGFGLTDEEISVAMKRMVCGSTRTLLESGLSPAEVMDLIPVKPLAEMETQVTEQYKTKLPAIYQKIKP
ncbi:MAG: NAD(P)-binding domain-containing protein [Verrucomicrobiae bacterium]|nr:NAD(P)-binding domain-containing protein [Verrucomicrobiae bacterium]